MSSSRRSTVSAWRPSQRRATSRPTARAMPYAPSEPSRAPTTDSTVPSIAPKSTPAVTAMIVTGMGVSATAAYSTVNASQLHQPKPSSWARSSSTPGRRTVSASHTNAATTRTRAAVRRIDTPRCPVRAGRVEAAPESRGGTAVEGIGSGYRQPLPPHVLPGLRSHPALLRWITRM